MVEMQRMAMEHKIRMEMRTHNMQGGMSFPNTTQFPSYPSSVDVGPIAGLSYTSSASSITDSFSHAPSSFDGAHSERDEDVTEGYGTTNFNVTFGSGISMGNPESSH